MLNTCYQILISVLSPLKLKIKQYQVKITKKKEPLNLMVAKPSQIKRWCCGRDLL